MTIDLDCTESPAIKVDGGKLNMAGHRLRCNPPGSNTGIQLLGSGAQLTNGSIRDCSKGVELVGAGNHLITNVASANNASIGFSGTAAGKFINTFAIDNSKGYEITTSGKSTFARAIASGSTISGFEVSGETVVTDSAARGRGFGLTGPATTVKRTWLDANFGPGQFYIDSPKVTFSQNSCGATNVGNCVVILGAGKVVSNTAIGNYGGFYLSADGAMAATRNRAIANTNNGFQVDPAGTGSASFTKNLAVKNDIGCDLFGAVSAKGNRALNNNHGIALSSSGGLVSGNIALQNTIDLIDDTACTASWSNNIFNTSFDNGGNCIR